MACEPNGGGGAFPAGVAFPVVADVATLDTLGRDGGDHSVAPIWAADGQSEGANTGAWPNGPLVTQRRSASSMSAVVHAVGEFILGMSVDLHQFA
jgi:hypothetical protein